MNRKGLIAMLDGLLAYTVAFISIGLIAMLMMDSQEPEIKKSYTLNVWAEDLADAVGMSMVDPLDYSRNWLSKTAQDPILDRLEQSISNIAQDKGIAIRVTVGSNDIIDELYDYKSVDEMETVVSSTRFLLNVDSTTYDLVGGLSVLTVKVGI